ncbi:hypothetical protein ACN47E_007575 [Coniothyrium glycines]
MNPSDRIVASERTKEALLAKTERLCNAITDPRSDDPWGGNGYLSTILRAVRMQDTSPNATEGRTELEPAYDYATSAYKELVIRESAAGLIKTAQDISTLIRDLQELWLFGGLDTLKDEGEQEKDRAKAVQVAELLEQLVKTAPIGKEGDGVKIEEKEGEN